MADLAHFFRATDGDFGGSDCPSEGYVPLMGLTNRCAVYDFFLEMALALSRLVRMDEFSDQDAAKVQNAFAADVEKGCFRYLAVGVAAFQQAQRWLLARTTALRTLDALHLACAALAEARFVTADQTLAAAAQKHGVNCLLVQ